MSIWPVRNACREDWPEIRGFFKKLDSESRYMYFGAHVKDDVIDSVWEKFEQRENDKFFLIEIGQRIVGVCQVAYFDDHAEISVAVDKHFREQGVAHALVERAVLWCKTHGVQDLMMFCIPTNNIIQKLIERHKLLPLMLARPAEARFMVPDASFKDYQQEALNGTMSWWMTAAKRMTSFPKFR